MVLAYITVGLIVAVVVGLLLSQKRLNPSDREER